MIFKNSGEEDRHILYTPSLPLADKRKQETGNRSGPSVEWTGEDQKER